MRVLDRLADLLWPRVCAVEGCSRASDRPGRHLCSRCLATLPFLEATRACQVCGAPVATETRHAFTCETCRAKPPHYARARSALLYEAPADQLVRDFKYRRATWLCEDFAELLEGAVRAQFAFAEIDVLVPVPLHPERLRARGYNQSALLARALARRLGRRCDETSLVRTRDTAQQANLDEEARQQNVKDAFAVVAPQWVRGRTVLLVDDVTTTGATLSHCAAPLVKAGAARVWCLVLARAVKGG